MLSEGTDCRSPSRARSPMMSACSKSPSRAAVTPSVTRASAFRIGERSSKSVFALSTSSASVRARDLQWLGLRRLEVESGFGDEPFDEVGPVLHPFQPGPDQ